MTLRLKTLALIFGTFVVSAGAFFYVASFVTLKSYRSIENQSANRDLQRLEKVFIADLKRLFAILKDYAYWDDTYEFVQNSIDDYVRSNFAEDTFSNPAIDFVVIVDRQGREVLPSAYGVSLQLGKLAIQRLLAELKTDGRLHEEDPEEYGFITVGSETLLIAMAPIFRSNGDGVFRGIMLLGRFLNTSRLLLDLRLKTQLDISLETISSPGKTETQIRDLENLLKRMPHDDLSVRVHVDGRDELGRFGQTVNWMLEQLQASKRKAVEEHERAENLLLNILPASIAEQLKATHEPIAHSHEDVSVLFADMVAGGLSELRDDHAEAIADMALGMIAATADFSAEFGEPNQIRIGINTGTVVAGVIGKKKFIYDHWGDTVNIASRMESSGETGRIQVTQPTCLKIRHAFALEERGVIDVKGRGKITT